MYNIHLAISQRDVIMKLIVLDNLVHPGGYLNDMASTYPPICINLLDNEFYTTRRAFSWFSLSHRAFSSGTIQDEFYTQNGFNMSTFRGMPSLVPKFARSVLKLDLDPQFEDFSEIVNLSQKITLGTRNLRFFK